jgi:hypothetical protein
MKFQKPFRSGQYAKLIIAFFALCTSCYVATSHATTVIIGNMPQTSDSRPSVNLNPERQKAQLFTMGDTSYVPTLVQLRLGASLGTFADFAVPYLSIRAVIAGNVGTPLAYFSATAPLVEGIQTAFFTPKNPSFALLALRSQHRMPDCLI